MSMARKRLLRDFQRLQDDSPTAYNASPKNNNILQWNAVIFGPSDTPFEDGTFRLRLDFNEEYPNKPPMVQFLTRMFHPNVYADGRLCLDILQTHWSPIYDVSAILKSIQSLLHDPNPQSPANAEAAQLFRENRREYETRVQQIVEQSWMDADNESDESDEEEMNETKMKDEKLEMINENEQIPINNNNNTTTTTTSSSTSNNNNSEETSSNNNEDNLRDSNIS
ncbi:hypothetical protein SNEBB_000307 [Seison nebaliae]|nr:hypothetical protein SNEBB_000307 [Seison nebaliae]